MKLRFIGADKSMGFRYGQIYDVIVRTELQCIMVYEGNSFCPYSSPQSFANNWEGI